MLQSLHIKNYAIIDEVVLDFEGGFNVITGETGAGKSILLGALKLINGNRADTKVLYDQNAKCIVEANFIVDSNITKELEEKVDADFDSKEVIIRREISSTGKSRAFINDTPVKLSDIKVASQLILDIHNQFDTLTITQPDYQLQVVDTLADNRKVHATYLATYRSFSALKAEIKKLESAKKQNTQDLDFIKFQLEELDRIPLDGIIKQELVAEHGTLSNSESIISLINQMNQELQESDHALSDRLTHYLKQITDLSDVNPQLAEIRDLLDNAVESLREADMIANRLVDNIDVSEERLIELTETLDHINKLEKKHNASGIAQLITLRDNYKLKTEGVIDVDATLIKKNKELDQMRMAIQKDADRLTKSRSAIFGRITSILEKSLSNLAIPNAKFRLDLKELPDYDETGLDQVVFSFSANKGVAPQPISDVASGGELSRVALSVKSMIADQYGVPTLIFDEIDTGISGAVAKRVGEILYHIADSRQVICITHSPQVASIASRHFQVEKRDTETRTITHVKVLDIEERIDEIAKMLSEDPPTGSARENARELLGTL